MLLSRAMGPPRAAEERVITWEEMQQAFQRLFFSGEEIETSRRSSERLSPVAAAHRILTNSFGMIPFRPYLKNGEERVPVHDAALDRIFKVRPAEHMSPFLLGKTWMSNAFWWGFGAVWNRRGPDGSVAERIALPSECCTIRLDKATNTYWYDYTVNGVFRSFSAGELSFLFFETYDGIHGRGLLDLARESIAADAMAQRYGKKFYQNGARMSGIVQVETDADQKTRDRVKRAFEAYASEDAFKVAVIDHGMTYTPIGLSQADAQFIESRTFGVEEISRFTGIPKYMLQVGKEAYNSNAQQRLDYVTDTLLPYVVQCEQEDTCKVLRTDQRKQGWYLHGNVEVLLRANPEARATFYEKMIQNAVYCPDEARAKEEKNPIPGGLGKQFLATKNLGSLESILKGGDAQ